MFRFAASWRICKHVFLLTGSGWKHVELEHLIFLLTFSSTTIFVSWILQYLLLFLILKNRTTVFLFNNTSENILGNKPDSDSLSFLGKNAPKCVGSSISNVWNLMFFCVWSEYILDRGSDNTRHVKASSSLWKIEHFSVFNQELTSKLIAYENKSCIPTLNTFHTL